MSHPSAIVAMSMFDPALRETEYCTTVAPVDLKVPITGPSIAGPGTGTRNRHQPGGSSS